METSACSTIAGHQFAERLGVHSDRGSQSRNPGRGREGLTTAPESNRGLDNPDLGCQLGLSLGAVAEQFAEHHDRQIAICFVASIAICLDSENVDFPSVFKKRLAEASLTHAALALRLGDCTAGFVSQIASGKRNIPIGSIERWATALGVSGRPRAEFLMLAGLAHVRDKRVRDLIASEISALRAEVAELKEILR